MYQQSVGNGNIDGGSQPEFAHERNFAGFVVQCVAGNQRARPAAEQTEFVQQVFGNAAEVAAVFFIVFFQCNPFVFAVILEGCGGYKQIHGGKFPREQGDRAQISGGGDDSAQQIDDIDWRGLLRTVV